jgi:hypothetical protein
MTCTRFFSGPWSRSGAQNVLTRGQFGHTRGGSAGHVLQHHMDFAGGYVPVLLRHEHGTSRQICKGWFLCWRQLAGRNGFVTDAQGEVVVAPPPPDLARKRAPPDPVVFFEGSVGAGRFSSICQTFRSARQVLRAGHLAKTFAHPHRCVQLVGPSQTGAF